MKKWLASIVAKMGPKRREPAGETVQHVDPNSILFTVPTLSNDLAPLDEAEGELGPDALQMHEDDWCQVEFFRQDYLGRLQEILREYKMFEESNRQVTSIEGRSFHVWREAYVRKVLRQPLLSGDRQEEELARLLGGELGPPPILSTSEYLAGRVRNGFTVRIGRNVHLYGYVAEDGIPVLAASVGENPDDESLTSAFAKLNAAHGLVLIDWKSQFVLLGVTAEGQIQVWQP